MGFTTAISLVAVAALGVTVSACQAFEAPPEASEVHSSPQTLQAIEAAGPNALTATVQAPHPANDGGAAAVSAPATPTAVPTGSFDGVAPLLPAAEENPLSIGQSALGKPILAYRVGDGGSKVLLVGGDQDAGDMLAHFEANSDQVPEEVSLWFIPSINPDGVSPGSTVNAEGVELMQNASNSLDPCFENDWSQGEGGPFPFSAPESQALRRFLSDAWVAIFSAPGRQAISPAGCPGHAPSDRLAALLSTAAALPVAKNEPVRGSLVDYLASEGVSTVTVPLASLGPDRIRDALLASMMVVEYIAAAGTQIAGEELFWLDENNTGIWQFPGGALVHPLSVARIDETVFLLDGGRISALDSTAPALPRVILAPGDLVDGVPVIEPIDLAVRGSHLLALDRAGDVYELNPSSAIWRLERYDRPVGSTSAHYYVALASGLDSGYLLETDYHLALRFASGLQDFVWRLPEEGQIDVAVNGEDIYVLSASPRQTEASLTLYRGGARVPSFEPEVRIERPRQVEATLSTVYVLDQAGRRIWALEPASGALLGSYQFADRRMISALWADPDGNGLLLAGRDALYLVGEPERHFQIEGDPVNSAQPIYDTEFLWTLPGLLMPIGGSNLTARENQMPGAPRHYRLGIHEGVDLYWQNGTAVRAVADGVVVRANSDYTTPSEGEFAAWRSLVLGQGQTSPEAQDFYRGMQVWIAHDNGLVSRYAHLSSIDPLVVEGASVTRGQRIGAVGNSGSIVSLQSEAIDAHLHFELWFGEHYLGQYVRPIETRELLKTILYN